MYFLTKGQFEQIIVLSLVCTLYCAALAADDVAAFAMPATMTATTSDQLER